MAYVATPWLAFSLTHWGVGAAYAAGGVGWLVGALLVGRTRVSGSVPPLILGALTVSAVAGFLLSRVGSLPVTLAAIAAYDAGIYATLIMTITIRLATVLALAVPLAGALAFLVAASRIRSN